MSNIPHVRKMFMKCYHRLCNRACWERNIEHSRPHRPSSALPGVGVLELATQGWCQGNTQATQATQAPGFQAQEKEAPIHPLLEAQGPPPVPGQDNDLPIGLLELQVYIGCATA